MPKGGNTNRGRKAQGEKSYIKSEKKKARRLRGLKEKDMEQDFKVKKLEKDVKKLTESAKGWARVSLSDDVVPTIVGRVSDSPILDNIGMFFLTPFTQTAVFGVAADGIAEFTGDSITMRKISGKYQVGVHIGSTYSTPYPAVNVRVLVACIHIPHGDPNSALGTTLGPNMQMFFQATNTNAGSYVNTRENIYDQPYVNNQANVTVYYDRRHKLTPALLAVGVPTGNGHYVEEGSFTIIPTKKNSQTVFSSGPGGPQTYQSVSRNAWVMMYMSDQPNNDTPPTIVGSTILRYEY